MPPRSLNALDEQIAALKRKLREAAAGSGDARRATRVPRFAHARSELNPSRARAAGAAAVRARPPPPTTAATKRSCLPSCRCLRKHCRSTTQKKLRRREGKRLQSRRRCAARPRRTQPATRPSLGARSGAPPAPASLLRPRRRARGRGRVLLGRAAPCASCCSPATRSWRSTCRRGRPLRRAPVHRAGLTRAPRFRAGEEARAERACAEAGAAGAAARAQVAAGSQPRAAGARMRRCEPAGQHRLCRKQRSHALPPPCRGPRARCAASSSPARRSWRSTSWASGTRCACAASCRPQEPDA